MAKLVLNRKTVGSLVLKAINRGHIISAILRDKKLGPKVANKVTDLMLDEIFRAVEMDRPEEDEDDSEEE